jgi:DNA-binding beta-propeller fold protein YncE
MQNVTRGLMVASVMLLSAACDAKTESADLPAQQRGGAAPSASSAESKSGSGLLNPTASAPGAVPATGVAPGAAGAAAVAALPPEMETTIDLQLPQASENYVYTVNPDAGTVAVIDASTQSIKSIKTGNRPTYLRTLAGTDNAIVLNVGSNKASIIRTSGDSVTKSDLSVSSGANAIATAPDGKHAVVYYNATYASAGQGAGSYQDVAVLTLGADATSDRAVSMTVGFRPRDVFFSEDGARAFVVTEDGVSVLDFADIEKSGAGIARLVTFGGTIDQKNLDISVTPDGRFALARAEGQSVLHLVELSSGQLRSLDLAKVYNPTPPPPTAANLGEDAGIAPPPIPVAVTDLDLMPGGQRALAVLRAQAAILEVPLPAAFDDPSLVQVITVPDQVVGSVTIAPDGAYALGYTTALDLRRVVIVDLSHKQEPRAVAMRKPVQAVTFTPDGKTALITHKKAPGNTTDFGLTPDQVIDRSYGYSLLRVASADVKLQATRTQLGPTPSSSWRTRRSRSAPHPRRTPCS